MVKTKNCSMSFKKKKVTKSVLLTIIVDIIMHLTMKGNALRGTNENISNLGESNQSGKFFNMINLKSRYNEPLRIHLESYKSGSLSPFFSRNLKLISRNHSK